MAGIYIHIPFCKQACHYCNFHFSTVPKQMGAFVDALKKEINITPSFIPQDQGAKEKINTLYFGGGSPSILPIQDLQSIFETLQKRFSFSEKIEITLEANPDDINKEKLLAWQSLGINRLSVGIQSFQDEELKWMNRVHTAKESLDCIDAIQSAGFDNYSIDLIYGSPLLDDSNWKKNVAIVIEKKIPHISCYALTVEPSTALNKMILQGKKEAVDADRQANQFSLLMEWMERAGYQHYEISNYALPGKKSIHNSNYWEADAYYGFGPSAHSFDGHKTRSWNIANNALYIQSLANNQIPKEQEVLSSQEQLNEYSMTALRTNTGIDLNKVESIHGADAVTGLLNAAQPYIQSKKIRVEDNHILLSKEGKLFADGIAAALFF